MPDPDTSLGRVAILWRGDEAARRVATPESSRFRAIFTALADVGVAAIPVVYEDDVLDAVARQLAKLDGVLVWVNPIHEGRNRATLDALLRDLAKRGVWVSAHPDVITKMGTKEVLYHTRTMSWGCDTAIYRTAEAMRVELPLRLVTGPRVIKRNRGNGGQGVWKVEVLTNTRNRPMVRVLDATRETSNELALEAFVESCIEYFADGCVIDQAFQARLSDGVVRCYMVGNRCAGFGYQKVKALIDSPAARAEASQRRYSPKSEPRFQHLRQLMEDEWTPQLTSLLGISARDLPMIWDADFMLGPSRPDGSDSYVLGEINVSSVFPLPDEAPREIALRVADRLRKQGHPPAVDPRIQNSFPTRDTPMTPKNTICLWYDKDAEEAARFYAATFPDSAVRAVHRAPSDYPGGKKGDVLTVEFTVLGIPCLGLNGGPAFKQSEAFSFQIATDDQAETDRYWNAIVGNGGQESACGWCKDKWGVSWQITPRVLTDAIAAGGDEARRAFEAMMTMRKIDVVAIEKARHG